MAKDATPSFSNSFAGNVTKVLSSQTTQVKVDDGTPIYTAATGDNNSAGSYEAATANFIATVSAETSSGVTATSYKQTK